MKPAVFVGYAAAALVLLLVACAKPVPAEYRNYVGLWRGGDIRLSIEASGNAEYVRKSAGSRVTISGPIHDFTREGFKIGMGKLSAGFVVTQAPALTAGGWKMTVDGVELSRVDLEKSAAPVDSVSL